MRILQVVPWFSTGKAASGYVQVVYNVSRELVKRGHEVEVYTSNFLDGKIKMENDSLVVGQIKVNYFNYIMHHYTFFLTPSMIPAVRKNLKEFDVIHIHDFRTFQSIVTHYYAKKYDVPYILQAHGSLPRIMARQRLKWIYDVLFGYRLLRNASKVIALTRVEAEQYRRMCVPEEKVAIIPNGIDISEYTELPPKGAFKKKFNIPEDRKIILYLGRIHRTKGIDFLIRAYAHLKNEMNFKDATLVIAGLDDGYLSEAESLVHRLGVSNSILFTGLLSEEDKIKAYTDASIVAYLGPFEPYGLVSLEAAACETPVIVAQGTPMAEIVNRGKFGFSVNYGDIASLSKRMYELICDDVLREELGRRGRDFVFKNFSWSNIVTKIEKVYEEILRD